MTIHLVFKFNILEVETVYVIFGLLFHHLKWWKMLYQNTYFILFWISLFHWNIYIKKKNTHNLCNAILSTITLHFLVRCEFSNCSLLSYDHV